MPARRHIRAHLMGVASTATTIATIVALAFGLTLAVIHALAEAAR